MITVTETLVVRIKDINLSSDLTSWQTPIFCYSHIDSRCQVGRVRSSHVCGGDEMMEEKGEEMILAPYVPLWVLCCNPINEKKKVESGHNFSSFLCWAIFLLLLCRCLLKRVKSLPPLPSFFVWLIDFLFYYFVWFWRRNAMQIAWC